MKAPRRMAAALLAMLLHLAALLLLLGALAPRRARDTPAAAIDVVWIKKPPVALVAQPVPAARARPSARRAKTPAALSRTSPAEPAALSAAVTAAAPEAEPFFDRQAALAAARTLAHDGDPARAGSVGAALDARKVYAEARDDKLGRVIASAKRTDCIKANGGGSLLTPLMWLLEKKGSGCKW